MVRAPGSQTRWLGIVAMVGGLLAVPTAFFLGAAWMATADGADDPHPVKWDEPFRDAVPAAFDFAGPDGVYLTYGRIMSVTLIGFLAGLWLVHRAQASREGRVGRVAFRVLFGLETLFTIGVAAAFFTPLLDVAFFVMLPAMLLSIPAAVTYGVVTIRRRVLPGDVGWLLVVAAILLLSLPIILGHNSIGLLGFFALWIRVGVMTWRSQAGLPAVRGGPSRA